MRDPLAIAQYQRRLVEMGCPARRIAENVRELNEHFQDLKQAGLDEGLPEAEAEALARESLGDPILLAENAVMLLRQSSWWGRHPVIGFCLLPLPFFLLAWVLCGAGFVGLCWLLGAVFGPAYKIDDSTLDIFSDNPDAFNYLQTLMNAVAYLGAISLVIYILHRMARRSAVSLRWILAACFSCALVNLFSSSELRPHTIMCGLSWPPHHWVYPLTPLLAAAILLAGQWRRRRRLAAIPMTRPAKTRQSAVPKIRWSRTPTFWIATVLLLAFAALVAKASVLIYNEISLRYEITSHVWPVERAATLALLKSRQSIVPPVGDQTINLRPFLNATLSDSIKQSGLIEDSHSQPFFQGFHTFAGRMGFDKEYQVDEPKDNNLKELPAGIHTFGGVPFDVEGRAQLAAGSPSVPGQKFPTRISVPIASECSRFHLLQGAVNLKTPGNKIAWVIVHYTDGSHEDMNIIGGQDVLDWWGPIYNTDARDLRNITSPNTELAWAGSNPAIKETAPDYSLRLYRTTFDNPHPDREISSIDYVSALSGAAPFLVGMTIEKP